MGGALAFWPSGSFWVGFFMEVGTGAKMAISSGVKKT